MLSAIHSQKGILLNAQKKTLKLVLIIACRFLAESSHSMCRNFFNGIVSQCCIKQQKIKIFTRAAYFGLLYVCVHTRLFSHLQRAQLVVNGNLFINHRAALRRRQPLSLGFREEVASYGQITIPLSSPNRTIQKFYNIKMVSLITFYDLFYSF